MEKAFDLSDVTATTAPPPWLDDMTWWRSDLNYAAVIGLLFNAGGKVEFGQDLRCLSILEAHWEKGHVLTGVQRRVLRKTEEEDVIARDVKSPTLAPFSDLCFSPQTPETETKRISRAQWIPGWDYVVVKAEV